MTVLSSKKNTLKVQFVIAILCLNLIILSAPVPADTPASLQAQLPEQQSAASTPRDPFSLSPQLMQDLSIDRTRGVSQFQPQDSRVMPRLKLKGIVRDQRTNESLALLDVGGQDVHLVRVGDEISFNSADPKQVIKIMKIAPSNLIVEVGTLGDLIMVR